MIYATWLTRMEHLISWIYILLKLQVPANFCILRHIVIVCDSTLNLQID